MSHGDTRLLSGSPFARGVAQASDPRITVDQITRATVFQVHQAREAGMIDPAARDYLSDQEAYCRAHAPAGIEELEGIARGFGLSFDDLFTYLHLGTLRDLHRVTPQDQDGCSAWASVDTTEGPLVVKNRDFSGHHVDVQRLMVHSGPDLQYGPVVCLGSLGSPGAYSSGMNRAGLAIADTQIGSRVHGVGWLRYFLMTELLRGCATVEQALAFVAAQPHAVGGSLVLADIHVTAAVELGVTVSVTGSQPWVARTNHFTSAELQATHLSREGYGIDANSKQRLACLDAEVPVRHWSIEAVQQLMARHDDGGPGAAPLCQHPDVEGSRTLSSVIYGCRQGRVWYHPGYPCLDQWRTLDLNDYLDH